MIERYLADLSARLDELGVHGRAADRVLAEARDHLHEAARHGEQEALRRFGSADRIARMIAGELATSGTRRAAYATFAALAVAGAGAALALQLVPAAGGWQDIFGGRFGSAGPIAAVGLFVLGQVAFVAGCLALVQAVRLGRTPAVSDAELQLLRRRSRIALAAGAGTLVALVADALNFQTALAGWWTWSTVAFCLAATALLGAAYVRVVRSPAPTGIGEGDAGDIFDDLAPLLRIGFLRRLALPGHPWRFAGLVAASVGLAGFVAGSYVEGNPGSGLVRGAFEAVALLICFAVLGRSLGLRRSNR